MAERLNLPRMSDTMEEGIIASILVKVGDEVKPGSVIAEVETDKATMDVPSPENGKVVSLKVAVGDKAGQGKVIMTLAIEGEASSSSDTPKADTANTNQAPQANENAGGQTSATEVKNVEVPDIGTDEEVDVIDVLVAVGEEVEAEQGLITLETL